MYTISPLYWLTIEAVALNITKLTAILTNDENESGFVATSASVSIVCASFEALSPIFRLVVPCQLLLFGNRGRC